MLNKIFVTIFVILNSTFFFNQDALAENCKQSSLINELDIQIACIEVNHVKYATQLINNPIGELSWVWSGTIETLSCNDEVSHCAQVSDNLDITFPTIDIYGNNYTVELAYVNNAGKLTWIYKSHRPINDSTSTTANNSQDSSDSTQSDILSSARLDEITRYIEQQIEQKAVPGAVFGIAEGNQIILLQAFGYSNYANKTTMTTDNLLHIGSTNKPLTTMMIAKLVDEGVLEWDTKAIDIYPDFSLSNRQYSQQITIRQLVNMTAGLPKDTESPLTQAKTLLQDLPDTLLSPPGEQYLYSNLSISIAAYLAVLANDKKAHGSINNDDLNNLHSQYVQLLQDKILTPIGMTNSYIYIDDARNTGLMANSHHMENNDFVVSESVDQQIDIMAPAGGLKSTIRDMLNYTITEMQQGLAPNGIQIVSQRNVIERQQLSDDPAGENDYGLGLEIKTLENGLRFIGHSGSFDNFNSLIGFFPDKRIAFVLLTNGDSEAALNLTSGGIDEKISQVIQN